MKRILSGAAVAGAVVLALASPAHADVVSHDLSAWNTSDTRSAGHYEVTAEGLHIWTDDNSSNAKVAAYYPAPEGANLSNVGTPAIDWTGTTPAPGLQIVLDIPGGTGADGILVGEPAVYGANWWLSNGSAQELKDKAPHHGGGQGSDNWGTLAEWNNALGGEGWISAIGFSLGSGVKGDGVIKSLTFFGEKYTFSPKSPATESPSPSPSASATKAAGGTAGGASPTPAQQEQASSLPVTGVPARTIGIAAGVLLVAGGLLVVATRRRRTTV